MKRSSKKNDEVDSLSEKLHKDAISGDLGRRIKASVFEKHGFLYCNSETEGCVDRVFPDGRRETGRYEDGVFAVIRSTNMPTKEVNITAPDLNYHKVDCANSSLFTPESLKERFRNEPDRVDIISVPGLHHEPLVLMRKSKLHSMINMLLDIVAGYPIAENASAGRSKLPGLTEDERASLPPPEDD